MTSPTSRVEQPAASTLWRTHTTSPGEGVWAWLALACTPVGRMGPEGVRAESAHLCPSPAPSPVTLALAPRMYRVYGKKNIKLEPVPLKGSSLDPR